MQLNLSPKRLGVARAVIAAIIIVLIVIVGAVGYVAVSVRAPSAPSTVTSTVTSTSTATSTSVSTAVSTALSTVTSVVTTSSTTSSTSTPSAPLGPSNSSQLTVIENEPPTSIDPSTGYFVGEEEVMANVYQGLIDYNYTSISEFAPVLASSWTISPSYNNYTFTLRQNAYFMNGHPFNASAMWFSINRNIVMNQVGASWFVNTLYNVTAATAYGYALPYGIDNALAANGYHLSSTNMTLRWSQAAKDLAAILSHFNPSNSTVQAIMSYPNQAVRVVNNYEVSFNLLYSYRSFLEVLASPSPTAVDPGFVDANGGVQPNSQNIYLNTHSMGTAPYFVKSYTPGEVMVLQKNPNYWAAKLPASQSNVMLTPPHIPVIVIQYAIEASQMIEGISDNRASLVEGPPIPALSPVYLASLSSVPGVKVVSFPQAAKFTILMITLDTQKYPYNITNFRLALAHAINYSEIFSSVTGPYAVPYVGPISPGLPYYNPGNLPPYNYDPALSINLLKQLGFQLSLTNGTTINPSGPIFSPTLSYANDDPAELKIAQEMQVMFLNVGLDLNLSPVTDTQMYDSISTAGTASGYPGMLLWYWFPSWLDPIYQDLVAQVNSNLFPGIAGDVSWLDNATVNQLTASLPFQTNPSVINSTVAKVYAMVYQQVPDLWLYSEVPYSIQQSYLVGVIYNPGIQGYYFPLMHYQNP